MITLTFPNIFLAIIEYTHNITRNQLLFHYSDNKKKCVENNTKVIKEILTNNLLIVPVS